MCQAPSAPSMNRPRSPFVDTEVVLHIQWLQCNIADAGFDQHAELRRGHWCAPEYPSDGSIFKFQNVTSSSLLQVVEELLGYLQAARMLAAAAAGRQPPVAQMAALGADDAAADTDAPEAMELDGALCGAQLHDLARPSLNRSRGTVSWRRVSRGGQAEQHVQQGLGDNPRLCGSIMLYMHTSLVQRLSGRGIFRCRRCGGGVGAAARAGGGAAGGGRGAQRGPGGGGHGRESGRAAGAAAAQLQRAVAAARRTQRRAGQSGGQLVEFACTIQRFGSLMLSPTFGLAAASSSGFTAQ